MDIKDIIDKVKGKLDEVLIHNYLVSGVDNSRAPVSSVVRAKNKLEAIEAYQRCHPDVVITDVKFLN